jgi:hypothetical protein
VIPVFFAIHPDCILRPLHIFFYSVLFVFTTLQFLACSRLNSNPPSNSKRAQTSQQYVDKDHGGRPNICPNNNRRASTSLQDRILPLSQPRLLRICLSRTTSQQHSWWRHDSSGILLALQIVLIPLRRRNTRFIQDRLAGVGRSVREFQVGVACCVERADVGWPSRGITGLLDMLGIRTNLG